MRRSDQRRRPKARIFSCSDLLTTLPMPRADKVHPAASTSRPQLWPLLRCRPMAAFGCRLRTVGHRGAVVVGSGQVDSPTASRITLVRTLDELPPHTRKLLTQLDAHVAKVYVDNKLARHDVRITRREILDVSGLSLTQMRMHLQRLTDLEHVLVHAGKRGLSFVCEILFDGDGATGRPHLSGLIDVDTLAASLGTPSSETPNDARTTTAYSPLFGPQCSARLHLRSCPSAAGLSSPARFVDKGAKPLSSPRARFSDRSGRLPGSPCATRQRATWVANSWVGPSKAPPSERNVFSGRLHRSRRGRRLCASGGRGWHTGTKTALSRRIAVGRKNWLFVGSDGGGVATAVMGLAARRLDVPAGMAAPARHRARSAQLARDAQEARGPAAARQSDFDGARGGPRR